MGPRARFRRLLVCLLAAGSLVIAVPPATVSAGDGSAKVVFIHHSVGQSWLEDSFGGLGQALAGAGFYVSDTNYGWGPDGIGDRTDIPDWTEWFTGPERDRYTAALFTESGRNSDYTRLPVDPGGENRVVMFKSCFPNSSLEGSPDDPPDPDGWLSVGHAKWVYQQILGYFASRPDKLFVVVTAPPNSDSSTAANARAFNDWLVYDWLDGYAGGNVAVFDLFTVLSGPDNHHRVRDGRVEHVHQPGMNSAYYRTAADDDHPNALGSRKATEEFVGLLQLFYSRWDSGQAPPGPPEATRPPVAGDPAAAPADPAAPVGTLQRVTGVRAVARRHRITVSWSAVEGDGYLIQAARGARRWRSVGVVAPTATRFGFRTTRPGRYRVRVAARTSDGGRGPYSAAARVRVGP